MVPTSPRKLRALRRAAWLVLLAFVALPLSACQTEKKSSSSGSAGRASTAANNEWAGKKTTASKEKAAAPKEVKDAEPNTEAYSHIVDNPFRAVASAPLSTFSIDVDTASYTNVRRFL